MGSPYLVPNRLPDILAAIQVMGSHFWDSRQIEHWVNNLGPKPQSAASWEALFADHPEFFGNDELKDGRTLYVLRLRRAYENNMDPDTFAEVPAEELRELKAAGKYQVTKILSRRPLTPSQVEALMKTAIELQVRAAALADRRRYWISIAVPALVGLAGAALGYLLKAGYP
jgi:hypothetical protein